MTYYIFKRNKKTGKKTVLDQVYDIDEARKLCKHDSEDWMEFTEDYEHTKN